MLPVMLKASFEQLDMILANGPAILVRGRCIPKLFPQAEFVVRGELLHLGELLQNHGS